MKVFVIFWVVCLCTLSIHSPSAWAVDPAIKNDPLKEEADSGFEVN